MRSPAHRLLVFALFVTCCLASASPGSAEIEVSGHALARVQATESPISWRSGGFGRLALGDGGEDPRTELAGAVQAVIDGRWSTGATTLGAVLHAVARAEPEAVGGRELGVVEAYVEASRIVGTADRVTLRLGHFLLDTSFENLEPAWASPYSSTFSALNTWIAEEVRPTGIQLGIDRAVGAIDSLRFSATAFGGDDTAGTLLAWRGWTLGDRLSVFGETLPLPPLPGLVDGAGFEAQRDDGTRPSGDDLDGRVGWAASIAWRRPETGSVRLTAYDNRGDRLLHGPEGRQEYAWKTEFGLLGGDVQLGELGEWTLAGEWMWGSTGMGEPGGAKVQADFEAGYLLASWARGSWRLTGRWDTFETVDRDGSRAYDPNDGSGTAWLAAVSWQPLGRPLRLVVEWLDVDAERPVIDQLGGEARVDGRSVLVEIRAFLDGLDGTD